MNRYIFEAEALTVSKNTGRVKRKFKFSYGKSLYKWNMGDYEIIEKYLGQRKDVQGDVSLIEVKEIEK